MKTRRNLRSQSDKPNIKQRGNIDMSSSNQPVNRPTNMSRILLKHSMTDALDCTLDWEADFEKMKMVFFVTFISPGLLLGFLSSLPSRDERFARIGITNALQISNRFNIKLFVAHNDSTVCYRLRVFLLQAASEKNDRLEIELLPI